MNFSARTEWNSEQSPWFRAVEAAKQKPLFDLSESNPTRCGFEYLKQDLLQPFLDSKNLSYEPDARGLFEARQAVAAYYTRKGAPVPPEHILLTAGTSEAYSLIFRLLANPGQALLVPEPGYPLLDHLAQLNDVQLVRYPLSYDRSGGWRLDRERFERLASDRVRGIIVVHPHNPTGHWTSVTDRQWLSEIAQSRQWALIVDEVFLDYSLHPQKTATTCAAMDKGLVFTLSGISKILALPQMKVSWMAVAGDLGLVKKALERLTVMADAYLSVSTPSQRALPHWMAMQESIGDEISARVRQNRHSLEHSLRGTSAELLVADGGWYAIVRFTGARTDEELALLALTKGVLVQPGYLFDLPEHHLVISLLPPRSMFEEGVRRLLDLV